MTKSPNEPLVTTAPARRSWLRTAIVIAVVLLILGALLRRLAHRPAAAPPAARQGMGMGMGMADQFSSGPQPVTVEPAASGDLGIYLESLGTVTPLATVTLRAQISGQLVEVDFKEGQLVKKGDVLAVIDPRPYEVALQQAHGQLVQIEAQFKAAQADLARYETLAKQDSISSQQVDTQRALVSQYEGQVETEEAAVSGAKLNLAYCHVTAPVSGRVGLRQVDLGNYVTPGDASGLVVLTQVTPITAIYTLSEDNMLDVASRLHSGATIPVDAYDRTQTRKLASGVLSTIDNEVDPTTGTFKLRALFPNTEESLFPNEFVNVRMLLKVDRGVTIIPTAAVERGQPGTFVYVVKADGTVASRPVVLGAVEGERVEVTSGLAPGERIVTDGADKLKDGMQVTVQAPPTPAAAAPAAPASAAPAGT